MKLAGTRCRHTNLKEFCRANSHRLTCRKGDMNYKVGDTVVCIDAMPTSNTIPLAVRAGEKYVVAGISSCCCNVIRLVGVIGNGSRCQYCGASYEVSHFRPYRFIKLPEGRGDE